MRSVKLDAYKGFACIFVVFIHCVFPGVLGNVVKGAARFAVPLFFMSAGYYCYCNNSDITPYILKKVKHVLVLLFAGSLPWILYEFVMNCFVGNTITIGEFLKRFFAVENFKDMLLWNNLSGFLGGGGVLWFVVALLYCYLGYGILVKLKLVKFTPYLIVVLLILHQLIALRVIVDSANYNVMYETNYWFFGFPMFSLGQQIRQQDLPAVLARKGIRCSAWIVLGFVVSMVECMIYSSSLYFGSILVAMMMVCDSQMVQSENRITEIMAYIGNKLSFTVYIMHYMVMVLLDKIFPKVLGWNSFGGSYMRPVIVLAVTLVFALFYVLVKERAGYVYQKNHQ